MKIKIEVVERAGWWRVKVCGLRHSRYRSRAAARHGAKRLAARVRKLSVQARSRQGACSSGNACASHTASCTASARCCEVAADHGRRFVDYEMRRTRLPVPTISKVSLSTTLSEPLPSAMRYWTGPGGEVRRSNVLVWTSGRRRSPGIPGAIHLSHPKCLGHGH